MKPIKVIEVQANDRHFSITNEGRFGSAYVLMRGGETVLTCYRIGFRRGAINYRVFVHKPLKPVGTHRAMDDLKALAGLNKVAEVVRQGISVVVCTRNRSGQLRNCLESLKQLDYDLFEVIVVDNAPEDDSTRKVVEGSGFRYELEEVPGLDRARNRGIKAARFGIIAFTDDDALVDWYWLRAVMSNLSDETISAVTGFVAPAELETKAQQLFEFNYGGMGHGFSRRVFDGKKMSDREKLGAAGFGVGANMAFRRSIFDQVGFFDPALDVGTPSSGGGDVEIFHRVVAKGGKLVYDPDMLVWHNHRREMTALKRQIFNNGRSFVCYLLTCRRNGTVSRASLVSFVWKDWLLGWFIKNLFSTKNKISRQLLIEEITGIFTGPRAYHSSLRSSQALDRQFNI